MADDAPQCKVEYLDVDPPEETNWIKRGGRARVTYPNNCVFEGTYDDEKIKQGPGMYIWMGPASADDETPVEKARFEVLPFVFRVLSVLSFSFSISSHTRSLSITPPAFRAHTRTA